VGLRLTFARAAILAGSITVASIVSVAIVAGSAAPFYVQTFAVPTGAMAPTIMGRHKNLTCPRCRFGYAVSASSEADFPNDPLLARARQIVAATCANCRYVASIDPDDPSSGHVPSVAGVRLMVSKIHPSAPSRWDVEVFPYPDEPQTMFVKRVVGMPGEELKIFHGDIYTRRPGGEFQIERKPAATARQIAQMVYDNDYPGDEAVRFAWPARWQPAPQEAPSQWLAADEGRRFSIAAAKTESWLRYRHLAPQPADWEALKSGRDTPGPRPQLITDFAAYNSAVMRGQGERPNGLHWVGDLMVECELSVKEPAGEALFDLVEGGRHFGCAIDLKSCAAQLSIDGSPEFRPVGQTSLRGPGVYRVAFANVDDQLLLWIDDQAIKLDAPTSYAPLDNAVPRSSPDDLGDLAPAGIGSRGAALEVQHIRLWRDVYYIAVTNRTLGFGVELMDYDLEGAPPDWNHIHEFFATPDEWRSDGGEPTLFDRRREVVFTLGQRQHFMLGDNNAYSKDSRLWEMPFVLDTTIVGKTLSIYWPKSRWRAFD
jgi:signal peptidase I